MRSTEPRTMKAQRDRTRTKQAKSATIARKRARRDKRVYFQPAR